MSHPQQTSDHPDQTSAPTIDWIKTAAGALAAVTAAVILSTLGAAGTLAGAAIGSVAATVGSALYAQGLAKSKQTVLKAQESALVNLGVSSSAVHQARRELAERDDDVAALHQAESAPDAPAHASTPATPGRLAGLPWRRVSLIAAAMFVVVMAVVTGFEAVSGRSVSAYTGGSSSGQSSTLSGVTGSSGGDRQPVRDGGRDGSSASPRPSQRPSASPSGTASDSATASTSASATASPSTSASASPSATATRPGWPCCAATMPASWRPRATPTPTTSTTRRARRSPSSVLRSRR